METKTSEAQKKAIKKYKKKMKRMTIEFYPSEMDLYDHIQQQTKKQTYVKDLIRADIVRTNKNTPEE